MPAPQLLIWPTFCPVTKPQIKKKKENIELEPAKGPIQGNFMLINAHRNAHTSAGPCEPGSAVSHQLSAYSTKNGAAIIYANDL